MSQSERNQTKSLDDALENYGYELPEEQIAQFPREGVSRMLVYDRGSGKITDSSFDQIPEFLPPESLLVVNNSRVLPARLFGRRQTGGKVEFLLLTPVVLLEKESARDGVWTSASAEGLLKASKSLQTGERIEFVPDLWIEVRERLEYGRVKVCMHWRGDLEGIFQSEGHVPLPPYIRRSDNVADRSGYQTFYARQEKLGSVAAPTAGFHFSSTLRKAMLEQGFSWTEVTLYVGYGTFSPIRAENIREHAMHREYIEIGEDAAATIARAKKEGRPVVAVGTTTVRTLESVAERFGALQPYQGWTNLYIRPGFRFQVVDHLITNFHLPRSSLLVMISAFAGRENMMASYRHALEQGYVFYSYGDAMLIL